MEITTLINSLINSYSLQVKWYRELTVLGQKVLGQITLSRGDLSAVTNHFREKQKLIEQIDQERINAKRNVEQWQKLKNTIPRSDSTQKLDQILAEVEKQINDFLRIEEQVKKVIEFKMANQSKSESS